MSYLLIRMSRFAVATAFLALLLPMTACGPLETDWSSLNRGSVRGALDALDAAGTVYDSALTTGGRAGAVNAALARLGAEPCTRQCGMVSDSSVWVEFTNGLLSVIMRRPPGYRLGRRGTTAPQVRSQAGGETFSPHILLSPFGGGVAYDQTAIIADKLRSFLDEGGAAGVTEFYGATVTVPVVREALVTSVLYWSGHGGLVPLPPSGVEVCGLLTGENGTVDEIADRVLELRADGYTFADDTAATWGRELFVVEFEEKNHIGILPGFISRYAQFERSGSNPGNRSRSIVDISCCYSDILAGLFVDRGADVYFGWSEPVLDLFAADCETTLFNWLCDTCTAGEAYWALGSRTEPGGATLCMVGDSNVMMRSTGRVKVNSENVKCYVVVARSYMDVTTVTANEGQGANRQFEVIWLGGTGTYDVVSGPFSSIFWTVADKTYAVSTAYKGVTGTIAVERLDGDVVTGRFSGVLGWWASGRTPQVDPPDETITVTDGFFKHSGSRALTAAQAAPTLTPSVTNGRTWEPHYD